VTTFVLGYLFSLLEERRRKKESAQKGLRP